MIGFERPLILAAAIPSLCAAFLYIRFRRKASAVAVPLGPPGGVSFVPPIGADLAVRVSRTLEVLGVLFLAAAAAGPVSVSTETVWLQRGADVVFVLDASPSMSARDMDGRSRFDFAKELVRGFADSRGADAVGLVAVGAEAALLLPPTVDRTAFGGRLASLAVGEFGDGTALGMGLSIAALHLRSSAASRRAVVLITDGENNAGSIHPNTAARALRSLGVSLWVVGVGSPGDAAIDYVDPATGKRRTGVFESRADPEALRAVAASGGGSYVPAPTPEAFARAFARIDGAEAVSALSRTRTKAKSLHAPLIAAGAVVLILARAFRRYFLGALF